jgi:hypothetical protein
VAVGYGTVWRFFARRERRRLVAKACDIACLEPHPMDRHFHALEALLKGFGAQLARDHLALEGVAERC